MSIHIHVMLQRQSPQKSHRFAHVIIVGLIAFIGLAYLLIGHLALDTVKTTSTHAEDLAYGAHQVLVMQAQGKECQVWPVRFNELVAQHQADRAHIDALIAEGHAAGC